MRERKFRAWNKITKKMFDVVGISWYDGEVIESYADAWREGGFSPQIIHQLKDCILMDFTGKTDKQGKEIYEYDILEYDGERCEHCKKLKYDDHNPYVVKWIDDETCFDAINDDNYMSCTIWGSEMKIIGNIYEDSHLLEEP